MNTGMHLSDDQSTAAAFEAGRMNMLPSKSPYDMQMASSAASSSAYSSTSVPAAYSSMAAYTPQMAGTMHPAMHTHMYPGKTTILLLRATCFI